MLNGVNREIIDQSVVVSYTGVNEKGNSLSAANLVAVVLKTAVQLVIGSI